MAQTTGTSPQLALHRSMMNAFLQPQMIRGSAKMVLTERVKAQSTWDNTLNSKSDSVYLDYPLNGTSNYDFNMMLFPYNYPYSTSPFFENQLGVHCQPEVYYSKHDHWTINPNTLTYGFYERDLAEYDADFNLIRDTALFADSSFYPNMRYVNSFNAANNVDSSHSFVWSGGSSSNAFKQFFSYDTSNRVVRDSTYEFSSGSWFKVARTLYTYDVPGNLIEVDNYSNNDDTTFTLPLIEQLKYVNTYDASGRLKTMQSSYYDGTMLKPYVKDTFGYTGTLPFHLSWKEYQYDAINAYWAPMTFMHKTLGGGGFPDVVYIDTFDSLANAWTPYYKWMISYNGFNDPAQLKEFIYNFTAFPSTPDFTTNYYYETFTNTTGIAQNATEPSLLLYPNPAKDLITVAGLDKNAGMISAAFYDAAGRLISREQAGAADGKLQLSVSHLHPGAYLLQLSGKQDAVLLSKIVLVGNQ
jgi:hypothetical protein